MFESWGIKVSLSGRVDGQLVQQDGCRETNIPHLYNNRGNGGMAGEAFFTCVCSVCVCVCEVLICSWILKKMLQGIQQTQFGTLNKSYTARISLELIFSRNMS